MHDFAGNPPAAHVEDMHQPQLDPRPDRHRRIDHPVTRQAKTHLHVVDDAGFGGKTVERFVERFWFWQKDAH